MNTATPFPWAVISAAENTRTTFRAIFEHAPIAVARCNAQGEIVEMNPAFKRTLDRGVASRQSLRLGEMVVPQDRDKTESLLRDLLASRRDRIGIEVTGAGHGQVRAKWTAWRQPGCAGEPDHALLIAEQTGDGLPAEESRLQTQRWEAVGRLAGGVVHDFNNLLTGVMLCCDLLLSSLDPRDRRRRYADDIRSAIVQATGLVRQLLVFARPQAAPVRLLCLNEVAEAMQDLLTRLIGENITLDLRRLDCTKRSACFSMRSAGGKRQRSRYERRNPPAPLRTILHHQECRPRNRLGTDYGPQHRYHQSRTDPLRKRIRPRHSRDDPAPPGISVRRSQPSGYGHSRFKGPTTNTI